MFNNYKNRIMKTKLFTLLLLILCISVKAQNAIAYNYYAVNCNLTDKNLYVFTVPKAFTYIKGSTYIFAPIVLEKLAEDRIEGFAKQMDPDWSGLYINQLSNGSDTGVSGYQATYQDMQSKMQLIYRENQKLSYRQKPVEIVLINLETGSVTSQYTLPQTLDSNKRGGTVSAY